MGTNTVQLTDQQCVALGQAMDTIPTMALWPGGVLRAQTDEITYRKVSVLDLDALAKTFASFGECLGHTLREHEATTAELRELRHAQRSMQIFLGTYRDTRENDEQP